MRALVVDDDLKISTFVAKGLREAGFAVDTVADGADALVFLKTTPADVAIVDVMLPGIDGLSLIERLRAAGIRTPVLILSARRSVDDRVEGLRRGGDDYLTKPFSFSELLARVQVLIRRTAGQPESTRLVFADVELDLLARRAVRAGRVLNLQPKEMSLLEYLMRNAGHVVSKTSILERVYDYGFDPQTNVVDVLVCRLRAKLDEAGGVKLLHTERGFGYVLRLE
ncbi:response regulator transcription factor [Nibricoccus sp. IMCC34717]|uniref:response regulator transcription factor n=1 Tax=Nibricoccus sp. IMCC34717 TaxID=3034021 RepID=UPI00384A613E